ncbi:hypothetical protein LCGC14_1109650 [marine sediment metagenome]|uniref:Uncharacterized protein n=1 Tax=marine sediment metagenome TaxID=412755 RepID=A0A0F9QDB5_9ZZZZ
MLAKVLGIPLLGAVYASGWWAWAVFDGDNRVLSSLIVVGLIYLAACIFAAIVDSANS